MLKLGAVLGGTAMLAACSGPSVGGDTAATAAPDTDWDGIQPATDITWWTTHPGQTSDLEAQFAADFLAKTGITVNVVTGGASYDEIAQKLQAAAGTDSMPDMVNASDTWWFRYMVNKQSIAMDGLMSHLGFEVDDFNKVFLDDYLYNGARYAVPYARSTPIFYYDKSIWQKAGLPDRAPDTWAELEEWAPAIMKVTGGNPAVRLPQGSIGTWAMSNVLWGRGGQYSDGWDLKLDQPETLEAAGYARGLVFDSKIANVAAASGDTAVDFAGGLAPCTIASAGAVGIVTASAKFPIGTGVLPGGPQGQFVPTGARASRSSAARPRSSSSPRPCSSSTSPRSTSRSPWRRRPATRPPAPPRASRPTSRASGRRTRPSAPCTTASSTCARRTGRVR